MLLSLTAFVLANTPPPPPPLRWSQLSVTHNKKPLLTDSAVDAHRGRLMGVLGPSGAGKTTLLLALSGMTPYHGRKKLTGVCEQGILDPAHVAMLSQTESFFGMLTVRETLALAAALQPGGDVSAGSSGTDERVDALLQTLGLADVASTRVGDATHRGISGGEKRRLAVGCELLGDPALLVTDEPTTGLDAYQAERVVRLVQRTAVTLDIPAIATLHQPRSSIWSSLDDVLVLAPGGRVGGCYAQHEAPFPQRSTRGSLP